MTIYLPIAELPVAIFSIFAMGLAVGFISGMFGVGGGFLMTPLLIFTGIPPTVAVASVSPYMAASSFSGALSYLRKGMVDLPLAGMLLAGGGVGTICGVALFTWLSSVGQVDLMIRISYTLLLGGIGTMMLMESIRAIIRTRTGGKADIRRPGTHSWVMRLPLKMRFRQARIYVSTIPVVALGFVIGALGAVLGVGGGFILVPALIYLLRVPTTTSVGTSSVLTVATMVAATILHASTNGTVDAVLAFVLMIGGTMGAQFGARTGQTLRPDYLRLLLALLVLSVGLRVAFDLVREPADRFVVTTLERAK